MRERIYDKKILPSINPAEVLAYLLSRGANKTDEIPGKAELWQLGGQEILVPLATHFADFARRMAELLANLEKVEDRSQLEILEDIKNSGFDVIRIRSVSKDSRQGAPYLLPSLKFMACARDIMLAAASSAATHKSSYQGKWPKEAKSFPCTTTQGRAGLFKIFGNRIGLRIE